MKKVTLLSLFVLVAVFSLQGFALAVDTTDVAAKVAGTAEEVKADVVAPAVDTAEAVKEEVKEEAVEAEAVADAVVPAPVAAETEKAPVL